jgi:signal transduction histidine kinase
LIIPSTIAFNLNRILKEIVSNIIRHAAASQIAITIDLTEKNWEFTLTDNGKDFDPSGPVLNGLTNMQSRAAEIDASLSIESELESGTCIRISSAFPASTSQKILS